MTSLQVLFGFLLLSVGYSAAEQLGKNKTFDAFAFGYFKCDGKPMPGVNVTLQVVYSDTGARLPPRTRIGREVAQSTVHRLPKHRPSGPRVEIRSLNTNSTDANGRYNLHGYNVMRGEYGVETTFRLRIVHKCYVGKLVGEHSEVERRPNVAKCRLNLLGL
ncbi:hypothetical protein AAVH_20983 [Aphelenchoides avenae]|nr:hypothetical protein AAVH_20983 [Aphelenchus avenae]